MKVIAIAASGFVMCCAAAQADQAPAQALSWYCQQMRLPCISDSQGEPAGLAQGPYDGDTVSVMLRPEPSANSWYGIRFTQGGYYENNSRLFFENATCSGQAYVLANSVGDPLVPLLQEAHFDGQTLWGGVGQMQTVQVHSQIGPVFTGGQCEATGAQLNVLAAVKLEVSPPKPPFSATMNTWRRVSDR